MKNSPPVEIKSKRKDKTEDTTAKYVSGGFQNLEQLTATITIFKN